MQSKLAWARWPEEPLVTAEQPLPVVGLFVGATERVCVLDTETTGLHADARIVEISAAWVDLRTATIERIASELINPCVPIPAATSLIHGIYDRDVRGKGTIQGTLPRVLEFIGAGPVVAHNAKYDLRVIRREAERVRVRLPGQVPVYCSMKAAKKAFPGQASYRLDALATSLSITVTGAHRAKADVQTTAQLIARCVREKTTDLRELVAQEDTL